MRHVNTPKHFIQVKKTENNAKGMKHFEVNYYSVLAMREIGKGHTALSTYCGYMNIPEPMNKKAFQDIQEKLHCVYTETVFC